MHKFTARHHGRQLTSLTSLAVCRCTPQYFHTLTSTHPYCCALVRNVLFTLQLSCNKRSFGTSLMKLKQFLVVCARLHKPLYPSVCRSVGPLLFARGMRLVFSGELINYSSYSLRLPLNPADTTTLRLQIQQMLCLKNWADRADMAAAPSMKNDQPINTTCLPLQPF